MKTIKPYLLFAGLLLCAAAVHAAAMEKSTEEQKLEAGAGELNKKYSEGQDRVAGRIKAQFGVSDARLMGLRYRKMNYGEIAVALALAQGLRGGITDENLHTIVAQRQGPPVAGWDKIARGLGLKLGPVLLKIQKLTAEVRRQEKADKVKKDKKAVSRKAKEDEKARKIEKTENSEKEGMKALMRS